MYIYRQNLHTHGILCDGRDDYEDTVKRAIELGFDSIGFSAHSYMPFSKNSNLSPEKREKYKNTVYALKEKYKGIIDVFCGIEFEMYSEDSLEGYEYVLGACHYFRFGDTHVGFDLKPDGIRSVINTWFDGDGMKYAKSYYETVSQLPDYAKRLDVIAHFDLVAKFSDTEDFFDIDSKEYQSYALEAVHSLAKKVKIFELNTGGVARGYKKSFYLAPFILKELKNIGCHVVIGSDCHNNDLLNFGFADALEYMRACGFDEVYKFTDRGFEGERI